MPEQLLYTWADRGLEGRGKLQVVAASRDLYTRDLSGRRQALTVCRYERPRGVTDPARAPVSLGWLDVDGRRYAFRRTYVGHDPFGRPGVFAAHVLVGSPPELPEAGLLASMGSASWWTGGAARPEDDGWLAPIGLADFVPADPPEADHETTLAVLAAVLAHRGDPVLLAVPAADLAAALVRADACLPGVLATFSVSTYEPDATAAWFSIAGSGGTNPTGRAISVQQLLTEPALATHRTAAALALSREGPPSPSGSRAVDNAWQAGAADPRSRRDYFLRVCANLAVLGRGDRPTVPELLPALRRPDTAVDVLDYASARIVIGEALARCDDEVAGALHDVRHRLPPQTWDALGRACAQASEVRTEALTRVVRMLAAMSRPGLAGFCDELWRGAHADPGVVDRWPIELLVHTCSRLETGPSPTAAAKAVIAAAAHHLAELAGEPGVPPHIWAQALRHALDASVLNCPQAAALLGANPGLVPFAQAALAPDTLTAITDAVPLDRALELHAAMSRGRDVAGYVSITGHVMARMPPGRQWTVLAVARRQIDGITSKPWTELLHQGVLTRMRQCLALPGLGHVTAELAELFAGRRSDPLGLLLDNLTLLPWGPRSADLGRIAVRIERLTGSLRTDAARYAFDVVVGLCSQLTDVDIAVEVLNHHIAYGERGLARAVLVAGDRALRTRYSLQSGRLALRYVTARLVSTGLLERRTRSALSDDVVQGLANDLVTGLVLRDPWAKQVRKDLQSEFPDARRWLASLDWRGTGSLPPTGS